MGLKLLNSEDDYDRIFMMEQSIFQKVPVNGSSDPSYTISIAFKRYKINSDDSLTFSGGNAKTIYMEDFYSSAFQEYISGNPILLQGLSGNQDAISWLISNEFGYELEVA